MPIRTDPWPEGTPCWVDLSVPDVPAAREFYAAVLDWTYYDTGEEFGHYQMCQRDGHNAAGLSALPDNGQPSAWTTYLASDDVDGAARKITENGGKLLAEPFDVPQTGRMCVAVDPQGAVFGVWQAAGGIGTEIYNEAGALVWNEAAVPDPDAVRQFYSAVFNLSHQPIAGAGPAYTTFHRDGPPLGGIGGLDQAPAGTPAHWRAYFSVPGCDEAVTAAVERGATILTGPMDTKYGRIAVILDPQGATFGIIGPVSAS